MTLYSEAIDLKGMLLSEIVVDKGNTDILCFFSYHRRVGSRGLQSLYLLSPFMKLHGSVTPNLPLLDA